MTSGVTRGRSDWARAFIALGSLREDAWVPQGAGVLLVEPPVVWLVTLRSVVEVMSKSSCHAWVARQNGAGLLDLGRAQEALGLGWIVHAGQDLAATLFPMEPSFEVKAFSASQCTLCDDLLAMQPAFSVGCMYGHDVANPGFPVPAVYDGVVSCGQTGCAKVYTTAMMFPHNAGGPFLLASQYGSQVSLAGLMAGNVVLADADPRALPVRVGSVIAIDVAWELLRSDAATAMRQRAIAGPGPSQVKK